MTDVAALLPPPSTGPFERAMAAGMSDDLPVPYAQILNPISRQSGFCPGWRCTTRLTSGLTTGPKHANGR